LFNAFLAGIGIIESQIAEAPVFGGEAKTEADGLGMPNVQVAVRLRWKPRVHTTAVFVRLQVFGDDVSNEVGLGGRLGRVHMTSYLSFFPAVFPLFGFGFFMVFSNRFWTQYYHTTNPGFYHILAIC
jgi:hypothetical protein